MNIVTCISGLSGEGMDGELLAAFVTANNNPLLTARFITCIQNETVRDIELNKIESALEVLPKTEFDIIHVFDRATLLSTIHDHVLRSDCVLYINMPENVMGNFEIDVQKIVDAHPNQQCGNSLDIVYTRTRILQ